MCTPSDSRGRLSLRIPSGVRKKTASAADSRGRLSLRHLSRVQRFHRRCVMGSVVPREAERLTYGFCRRCRWGRGVPRAHT